MAEVFVGNFGDEPSPSIVHLASLDVELVAFYEINNQGYTDAVDPSKADIIQDLLPEAILGDISMAYGITMEQAQEAYLLCAKRHCENKHQRNLE